MFQRGIVKTYYELKLNINKKLIKLKGKEGVKNGQKLGVVN